MCKELEYQKNVYGLIMKISKELEYRRDVHDKLDRLSAEYLLHNPGSLPSKTTVLNLMEWNYKKLKEEEEENCKQNE